MEILETVKIIIVENEPIIAEDIKDICELAGFSTPTICYNYHQAIFTLQKNNYDLALLDINLESDLSGLDIAYYLNEKKLNLPVIFITSYFDKKTLEAAKIYEPAGYITKPFNQEQLICAIEIVLSNKKINSYHEDILSKPTKLKHKLTDREYEIISLIFQGKTNEEIAATLYLSVNTIKFHIKNMYEKLNVKSRTQLLLLNPT